MQERLQEHVTNWLGADESLSERQKGNLGEYITFQVACDYGLNDPQYEAFLTNAKDPLGDFNPSRQR